MLRTFDLNPERAMLEDVRRIHLLGIGGIGVSGVARILNGRGFEVSGSDVRESSLTEALRAEGYALTGPHSADTMFHARARAGYDAAVAMYHDQALIPIKTIDFAGGVNVTLGLPFIRTSPDHGTAFDIAGRGVADPTSLVAALEMARDMAVARAAA